MNQNYAQILKFISTPEVDFANTSATADMTSIFDTMFGALLAQHMMLTNTFGQSIYKTIRQMEMYIKSRQYSKNSNYNPILLNKLQYIFNKRKRYWSRIAMTHPNVNKFIPFAFSESERKDIFWTIATHIKSSMTMIQNQIIGTNTQTPPSNYQR